MDRARTPDDLLSGPRGRRLCLAVAELLGPGVRAALPVFAAAPLADEVREALAALLGEIDPTTISALEERGDNGLWGALGETTEVARYWQEPDENHAILAQPTILAALRPVAEAICADPRTAWWASPMDTRRQRHVRWLDDSPSVPLATAGAAGRLASWRAATLTDERESATRPSDPTAMVSGQWWSIPALVGLPSTTSSRPGLAAIGLALVEDGLGWQEALVTPVAVRPGIRVYEITGAAAWSTLATRYPLDLSLSRRHDWWRTTGEATRWVIPDWEAVSHDFDAVHLTVWGYLCAAGRAIVAGEAKTVLAGWDPDRTYWLTDVLAGELPATEWHRTVGQALSWSPAGTE
ncbi:hypothetical protein [Lacisediminihabitans sp.]|uniref:hypothetical protein n=1 Tax=Lacisediminihabitans sp. TaxID=2787631 RepID=UPI00374DAA58